ncbi:hypothetical protein CHL67_03720 [Prosthecochloris sp. GSB1]|uniref:hypothetical protein n=1 Tax=Prosthecochloris sp. GSB1 TaxID=281093 RepID=UPI000B8C7BA0|nr:hypothetical protein [Prosthecochloris sp. GSB1]ASQ90156.1 hypothetical protein CHL67_03720 [Prosthecochloris sp. GSB1]
MRIRLLWMQAVRSAWASYIRRLDMCSKEQNMHSHLAQKIDMDMTLEEFGEMVFIEGFVAGEKYTKKAILGSEKREITLN